VTIKQDCLRVLQLVLASSPSLYLLTQEDWTRDVNTALRAVRLAGDGDRDEAVRLSSIVADRWGAA